jgi:hypothetical protein
MQTHTLKSYILFEKLTTGDSAWVLPKNISMNKVLKSHTYVHVGYFDLKAHYHHGIFILRHFGKGCK